MSLKVSVRKEPAKTVRDPDGKGVGETATALTVLDGVGADVFPCSLSLPPQAANVTRIATRVPIASVNRFSYKLLSLDFRAERSTRRAGVGQLMDQAASVFDEPIEGALSGGHLGLHRQAVEAICRR